MRRLNDFWKKVIAGAPDVFSDVYSRIVGTVEVSYALQRYVVFVLDDGSLMQSRQSFHPVRDEDWEPFIAEDREEMGRFLYFGQLDFLIRAQDEIRASLPEGCRSLSPDRIYEYCSTAEDGWFIVLSKVQPVRWVVCGSADDSSRSCFFYLEWLVPGPMFRVGSEFKCDGRWFRIADIRQSDTVLHNPLVLLEEIPD